MLILLSTENPVAVTRNLAIAIESLATNRKQEPAITVVN
jgi:hypothetical protein